MKKLNLYTSFLLLPSSLFLLCSASSMEIPVQKALGDGPTLGSKLATEIDLNDSTEAEIRSYYSSLNSLGSEERTGNNLLKNLKPILQDFTYYKYDDVWKIYEITDREWSLSPAASDSDNKITYDEASNKFTSYSYGSSNSKVGSNPYVHTLYRNRDEKGVTLEEARIKEWGDHNSTGTNREHVWCQSRGFKADSGAEGPAGTDIHHLISGDGKVNQSYHNNSPYGYVDKTKEYKNASQDKAWLDGNLLGPQLHTHAEDKASKVFEPQDSGKGDIARACFYMAACYNNFSGSNTITQFNPNLLLADYATDDGNAEESSASHPVTMGILSDLLEWHKLDPVDEYEIHRNNLIYKNYQHNRNPFIDFPEWVDMIWGEGGSADPSKDKIAKAGETKKGITFNTKSVEVKVGETKRLRATPSEETIITFSIDDPTAARIEWPEVWPNHEVLVTALVAGKTTTLHAKITIDGVEYEDTCIVKTVEEYSGDDPAPLNPLSLLKDYWYILLIAIVVLLIVVVWISSNKKRRKKAAKTIKKVAKKAKKKLKK